MRFRVQRKRLTEGLRPNHGICLPSHLTSSLLKPSNSSAFNPAHHVCISKTPYKTHQKAKEKRKIFLKRQSIIRARHGRDVGNIRWGIERQLCFPWWLSGKESACQCGDLGLIPGAGRSPGEENGKPLLYSSLGNPTDREAWWAAVLGATKESNAKKKLNNNNNNMNNMPRALMYRVYSI